jgi:hypothetical protein
MTNKEYQDAFRKKKKQMMKKKVYLFYQAVGLAKGSLINA